MLMSFAAVFCVALCAITGTAATTSLPPSVSVASAVYESAVVANPRDVVLDNVTVTNALTISGGDGDGCRVTITNSRVGFLVVTGTAVFPCALNIAGSALGSAAVDTALAVLRPTAASAVFTLQHVTFTAKVAAIQVGISGRWSLTDCNVTVPSSAVAEAGVIVSAMDGGSLLLRRVAVTADGSGTQAVAGVMLNAAVKSSTVRLEDSVITVDGTGGGTGLKLQGEAGTCLAVVGSTITARCATCPTTTTMWVAVDVTALAESAALSVVNSTLTARANAATALRLGNLTRTPLVTVDNSTLVTDAAYGASGHLAVLDLSGPVLSGYVSVANSTVVSEFGACVQYPSTTGSGAPASSSAPAGLMLRSNTFGCNAVAAGATAATPGAVATFVQCVGAVRESDRAAYGYGTWAPCADTASVLADLPVLGSVEVAGLSRCAAVGVPIAPFALPGSAPPPSDVRDDLICDGGVYGALTLSASATITGCSLHSLTLAAPTAGSVSVTIVGSSVRELNTAALVGALTVRRSRIGSPWTDRAMNATVRNTSTVTIEDSTINSRVRAVATAFVDGHLHLARTNIAVVSPASDITAISSGPIRGTVQLDRVSVSVAGLGASATAKGVDIESVTGTFRASYLDATVTCLSGSAMAVRLSLHGGCATIDGLRLTAVVHQDAVGMAAFDVPVARSGATLALRGRPAEGYGSMATDAGNLDWDGWSPRAAFTLHSIVQTALAVSNVAINSTRRSSEDYASDAVRISAGKSVLAFTNVTLLAPSGRCLALSTSRILLRGVTFQQCETTVEAWRSSSMTQVCLRNSTGRTDAPLSPSSVVTPCTSAAMTATVAAPVSSYSSLERCAAAASVAPYRSYPTLRVTGSYTAAGTVVGRLFITDPTAVVLTNVTLASVSISQLFNLSAPLRVDIVDCTVLQSVVVDLVRSPRLVMTIRGSRIGTTWPRTGISVPTFNKENNIITVIDSTVHATHLGVTVNAAPTGDGSLRSSVVLHNVSVLVRGLDAVAGLDFYYPSYLVTVNVSTIRVEGSETPKGIFMPFYYVGPNKTALSVLHSDVSVFGVRDATAIVVSVRGCVRVEDSHVVCRNSADSFCIALSSDMVGRRGSTAVLHVARNTLVGSTQLYLARTSATITDNTITAGFSKYAIIMPRSSLFRSVTVIGNNTIAFSDHGIVIVRGPYSTNTVLLVANRMLPESSADPRYFDSLESRVAVFHGCNVDGDGNSIDRSAFFRTAAGTDTSDCSVPRVSACGVNHAVMSRLGIGSDWVAAGEKETSEKSMAWVAGPVVGGALLAAVGCGVAVYFATRKRSIALEDTPRDSSAPSERNGGGGQR